MWDAMFVEDQKDEWLRLREVMWGHCQDVGRDPTEIACSSHLSIAPDPDPGEVAQRAATMFDTGIDVVILGFTAAHDGGTVESIATAIAELN
jgi:hypothetical protein